MISDTQTDSNSPSPILGEGRDEGSGRRLRPGDEPPLTLPSPQGEGTLQLYILINSRYRG